MDFLDVDGKRYIKLKSVTDTMKQLSEEASKEGAPELVSQIIDVLLDIFTSAGEAPKENIETKDLNVVKYLDSEVVQKKEG